MIPDSLQREGEIELDDSQRNHFAVRLSLLMEWTVASSVSL